MCTHLTKCENRYYIRRKIPVHLHTHFECKEIVKSLGTADRAKPPHSAARKMWRLIVSSPLSAPAQLAVVALPAITDTAPPSPQKMSRLIPMR